jgi:DNA-binding NarL/FixJ family response regulator
VITVLIADDHAFVRGALVDLFAATDDITVVAECTDGSQVLAAALRTRPQVVLLDLVMPGATGLEAARELRDAGVPCRVVLLTGSFSPAAVREASELGAAGYLLKGEDPGELPQRVRDVAAGGTAWSAPAAASLSRAH